MRRNYLLGELVGISLLLIACGNSNIGSKASTSDYNTFSNSGSLVGDDGDAGVYFSNPVLDDEEVSYLFYYDEQAGQVVKLCGDTTCQHNTSSCNAAFGCSIFPYSIQYYNDRIYLYTLERENGQFGDFLYSVKPDGTDRVCLGQFKPEGTSANILQSEIAENTVYILAVAGTTSEGYEIDKLYRQSLETGQKAELIYENENLLAENRIGSFHIVENELWAEEVTYSEDGMVDRLWKMDLSSLERETVLEVESARLISWVLEGDKVYYSLFYQSKDNNASKYGPVYEYECSTTETVELLEKGGLLTYDGTYLYVSIYSEADGWEDLGIYDLDGNLKYNLPKWENADTFDYSIYLTSQNNVIFSADASNGNNDTEYMYFLSKDKLMQDELDWDCIEVNYEIGE